MLSPRTVNTYFEQYLCLAKADAVIMTNLLIVLGLLQKAEIAGIASAVFKTTDMHSSEFLPVGTAYLEAEKLRKSSPQQSSA